MRKVAAAEVGERGTVRWPGAAIAAVVLLVLAPACGGESGGGGGGGGSSPSPEAANGAGQQGGARATPTLVPFFKKLEANGTPTVLTLDSILPGATCTVSVTVPNPDAAGRTLTFTARDDPQLAPMRAGGDGHLLWTTDRSPKPALARAKAARWDADCKQFDRAQPNFVVYHASTSFTSGSFSSTSTPSRSPGRSP